MAEVAATRTPATESQMRAALLAASPALTPNQLARLLAHTYIETRGWESIVQHNVGNLIATAAQLANVDYWRPSWFTLNETSSERDRTLHERMQRGEAPEAFRAYSSFSAGVIPYVRAMEGKFRPMLDAATPDEFVRQIRETGYANDPFDHDAVVRNFSQLYERFGGTLEPERLSAPAAPGDDAGPALLLGAALATAALIFWGARR